MQLDTSFANISYYFTVKTLVRLKLVAFLFRGIKSYFNNLK